MEEATFLQATAILLSTIIAVGGWLFHSYKEREFRRFELRTKYRIDMFESALVGILELNASNQNAERIVDAFVEARPKIHLFGSDDEVRSFELLLSEIEKYAGKAFFDTTEMNKFPKLLVKNFRNEIGLPPRKSTSTTEDG